MNVSSLEPRPKKIGGWELGVFIFFLLWMAIGLVVTGTRFSESELEPWHLPPGLRQFIAACLRHGDPFSILLGTIPTYAMTCRTWGVPRARRWALLILLTSGIAETVGTLSGWPFGPYHYTENFGPRIGGILPFVIPFSWLLLVTNMLFLSRYRDYGSRWSTALVTALGVTFIDWVMEPFAVSVKSYWLWDTGTVPWQNYVSWFLLTFCLTLFFAPPANLHRDRDARPFLILGSMLMLFIVGRWAALGS